MPRAQLLIRLFYAFQVTVTMMLWMPIFYKYQQQMGLTDPQIFQIQSIYYLSFCLLEIPTGFLADRLGHRGCMRVGAALHILTHLLPVMAPTYQGFLWHWLLLALSRSLISGAASAYLYNQLEALGQSELYKEAEGRGRAWSLAAKVVGFYLTDHLVAFSPSLPYTASAASAALSTLIAFQFPKALPVAGARPGSADTPRLGEVLRILLRSPAMLVVIGQGVALFTLTRIVQVNLFQPLLLAQNYSQFGTVLAINTLCEAVGAAYPKALRRWMSDLAAVFWLTLAMGLCCWGLTLPGASNCFWWLNAFAVVTGLSYPIQRQVMNEHIPDSRYRASLLSAESLVDRAVCAWVAHQLGPILQAGQMGSFLHYSALASVATCLVLAPLYSLFRLRRKG